MSPSFSSKASASFGPSHAYSRARSHAQRQAPPSLSTVISTSTNIANSRKISSFLTSALVYTFPSTSSIIISTDYHHRLSRGCGVDRVVTILAQTPPKEYPPRYLTLDLINFTLLTASRSIPFGKHQNCTFDTLPATTLPGQPCLQRGPHNYSDPPSPNLTSMPIQPLAIMGPGPTL